MKPKYVYHGSGRKLEGDQLIPKQARDLEGEPENTKNGIYASDLRDEAIAMGILSCKGVKHSSCHVQNDDGITIDAVIYDGWPEQDHFYLYTLSSETFQNKPEGSSQWVSLEAVKPERREVLRVKDYIHLIRKATEEEREEWNRKYRHKIYE